MRNIWALVAQKTYDLVENKYVKWAKTCLWNGELTAPANEAVTTNDEFWECALVSKENQEVLEF